MSFPARHRHGPERSPGLSQYPPPVPSTSREHAVDTAPPAQYIPEPLQRDPTGEGPAQARL
jgi:hypothetical protein